MAQCIKKIIISCSAAPQAIGPYSQATLVNQMLFISGQIGMDAVSGKLVEGGTVAQARKALENIGHILRAAGTDYKNVVKTTVLLADIQDFAAVNDVYKEFFPNEFPARAAYQVAALPKNGKIEIEAIAFVEDSQKKSTL